MWGGGGGPFPRCFPSRGFSFWVVGGWGLTSAHQDELHDHLGQPYGQWLKAGNPLLPRICSSVTSRCSNLMGFVSADVRSSDDDVTAFEGQGSHLQVDIWDWDRLSRYDFPSPTALHHRVPTSLTAPCCYSPPTALHHCGPSSLTVLNTDFQGTTSSAGCYCRLTRCCHTQTITMIMHCRMMGRHGGTRYVRPSLTFNK